MIRPGEAMNWERPVYDPRCTLCRRLAAHLKGIRRQYPGYFAQPVPPFGVAHPRLLVVGLAPGMHGANATGRPFTGDFAGSLLYRTLHEFGFSNRAVSLSRDDGLELRRCRITNAVKCLPPGNRPLAAEIGNCNRYLRAELESLKGPLVVLALGRIAHDAVLKALDLRSSGFSFSHGAQYRLDPKRWLVDSYHCSRYNTQTGRLSKSMFRDVLRKAVELIDSSA